MKKAATFAGPTSSHATSVHTFLLAHKSSSEQASDLVA